MSSALLGRILVPLVIAALVCVSAFGFKEVWLFCTKVLNIFSNALCKLLVNSTTCSSFFTWP